MVAWKAQVVKEQPGTGNRKFRKKSITGAICSRNKRSRNRERNRFRGIGGQTNYLG